MTKEAQSQPRAEVRRAHRPDRGPEAASEPLQHPLLVVQRTAGNRAVQRLVAEARSPRPQTIQRAVLQRILSPGTAAMGHSATSSLLSGWSGAYLRTTEAARQVGALESTVFDLLEPITMVQATLAIAEHEPAPGGGGSEVTPVTPTEVPVPTGTTEERP